MAPWKNKNRHSNNEIQDAPHASTLLDSVSKNEASAAPSEVSQSHQPPTSVELPASDVVGDKEVDEAAISGSKALQALVKNLG